MPFRSGSRLLSWRSHCYPRRRLSLSEPKIRLFSNSLHNKEGADGQDVDAGAIEAADGGAGIGDQRLAEKIERCVDEDGSGSGFAEFMEQAPQQRIGLFFHGMNADGGAVEGEAFQTGHGTFQIAQRSHETAVGAAIEK